jgi:MFS family permease
VPSDPALDRILRVVGARSLHSFGRQILARTVGWELWERTHDNNVIGAVGLVQVIPVVLLFVPSGGLVDRSDRRQLAMWCAFGAGAIALMLALASGADAPVPVYFAILLAMGCVTSVSSPASSSLIPMMVPREDLQRANRIGSSLSELASIGGPALAGLALIVVHPTWVYAAVVVTATATGILYRSLPPPRPNDAPPPGAAAAARRDWRAGLRFIFRNKLLLPALTLDMFAVLFAGVTALLPAVATDVLHVGSFGYGVLCASEAVGGVIMAIVGSRIAAWKRPGRVLLIVVALFGLATMGFGFSTWFPLSVALLVIGGSLDNISVVIRLTLEQMVVPDRIRGRVGAVHFVFIGMSNELGAAESGFAAGLVGTVPAIVGGGAVALLVVAFVATRWRALAAMPPLAELAPDEAATAG